MSGPVCVFACDWSPLERLNQKSLEAREFSCEGREEEKGPIISAAWSPGRHATTLPVL